MTLVKELLNNLGRSQRGKAVDLVILVRDLLNNFQNGISVATGESGRLIDSRLRFPFLLLLHCAIVRLQLIHLALYSQFDSFPRSLRNCPTSINSRRRPLFAIRFVPLLHCAIVRLIELLIVVGRCKMGDGKKIGIQ